MSAAAAASSYAPPTTDPIALPISLYPRLKCAVYSDELSCVLTLTAAAGERGKSPDLGGPDVRSLSAAVGGGVSGAGASAEREVPLLISPPPSSSKSSSSILLEEADSAAVGSVPSSPSSSAAVARLLRAVRSMDGGVDGLIERVSDAATASPSPSSSGPLEDFVSRCEAAFGEFLSAVRQHLRREARERRNGVESQSRRRGVGVGSSRKRPREGRSYYGEVGSNATGVVDRGVDPAASYYRSLVDQLTAVEGTDGVRLIDLSDDLRIVTVTCEDGAGREHELMAELPPTFPLSGAVSYVVDLPSEFEPRPSSSSSRHRRRREGTARGAEDDDNISGGAAANEVSVTAEAGGGSKLELPAAVLRFLSDLSSHSELWDELDDLDGNAWILEPALPARRASAERRVAVRTGLSAVVTLNIDRPRCPPAAMRLVGAAKDLSELRASWRRFVDGEDGDDHSRDGDEERVADRKVKVWNNALPVRSNLEAWLGSPLPSPATTSKSDYVAECGICYTHRLPDVDDSGKEGGDGGDGSIPDASCSNPSCARSYHESCLFEWLHSLPGARISFDRLFGTCPYCCESLSVRVHRTSDGGAPRV